MELSSERGLNGSNDVRMSLECLRQNTNWDGWFGSKHSISNGDNACVLAAQGCNRHCVPIPSGKTNTSPLYRTLEKSRLPSWFEDTNPTSRVPTRRVKISVARGCVWGALMPWGTKGPILNIINACFLSS